MITNLKRSKYSENGIWGSKSFPILSFFFLILIFSISLSNAELYINLNGNGQTLDKFTKNVSLKSTNRGFVPYTGAGSDVDLGTYDLYADWVFAKVNWSDIQNVPSGNITNTEKAGGGPYLYNDSTTIYWNSTYGDTQYVLYSGGADNLDLSGYNITADYIFGTLNITYNQTINVTLITVNYLNVSNVTANYINVTNITVKNLVGGNITVDNLTAEMIFGGNATFDNVTASNFYGGNFTGDWFFGKIDWSNIQNVPSGNITNTQKNASGYLYNDSTTIYWNDTIGNNTYVPYEGATRNVNLSDKNITAHTGNFTDLYVSNSSLYIGAANISSINTSGKIFLNIPKVYINSTAFVGDGSRLTNISFEGGNAVFNGSVYSGEGFNSSHFYGGNFTGDNITVGLVLGGNVTVDNVTAELYYGGNYTGDWGFMKINWSDIQNAPVFLGAQKNATGYLYNDTYTIYLNDTILNASINNLINQSIDSQINGTYVPYLGAINNVVLTGYNLTAEFLFGTVNWSQITNVPTFLTSVTNNPYLYLNGTAVGFNETKLNETISSFAQNDTQKNASGPYLYNDSTTIYFNETQMNVTVNGTISDLLLVYLPQGVYNQTGKKFSGNLTSIQYLADGNYYVVNETNGNPGFDIRINFTDVDAFNKIIIREWYKGGSGHDVEFELYNLNTSSWDIVYETTDEGKFTYYDIGIIDDKDYINESGKVQFRIYHDDSGSSQHYISVDYVVLQQFAFGPSMTEQPRYISKFGDNITGLLNSSGNISAAVGNFTELYTSNGTLHIGNVSVSAADSGGEKILKVEEGAYINATGFVGDGSKLTNISFEGGNANFNGSVIAYDFNGSNFFGGNYTGDNITVNLYLGGNFTGDNMTADQFFGGNFTGDYFFSNYFVGDGSQLTNLNISGYNLSLENVNITTLSVNNLITNLIITGNLTADNVTADNFYGGNFTGDQLFAFLNWSYILNIPNEIYAQKNASGPYLYNDSTTIYFNESVLNATIDDRDTDTNTEKNATGYLYNDSTTIYLNDSILNQTINNTIDFRTNGTYVPYVGGFNNLVLTGYNITANFLFGTIDWSQLVNVPFLITGITNTPYLYLNGSTIGFNESILNATIDDRDTDTDSRMNVSGPYLYNNTYTIYFNDTLMNATIISLAQLYDTNTEKNASGPYLYNDSVTIYLNETVLNATILNIAEQYDNDTDTRMNTSGPFLYNDTYTIYFNGSLMNLTVIELISQYNIDTRMNTSGPYLYNDTYTIYLNETVLNSTIDDRDTDTRMNTTGFYLYNNTTTIFFNETQLNRTIQDLAVVSPYNKTIRVVVSGGVGSNITSAIQYQINEIIVEPPSTSPYRFQAAEYDTGTIIDRDRTAHVGIWDIFKNYQINNKQVQANVTGADGVYNVTIKYIGQFE